MAIEYRRHLFTVDDYYAMGASGILGEDDRVELIEGEIVEMVPIGSSHSSWQSVLISRFSAALGGRAILRVGDPVRLSDLSEPQPDLALVRPRDDWYEGAHPGPRDVLLLVEVSDSSLRFDRDVKLPLYARAGSVEVWIVDVAGEAVDRYREPGPDGYAEHERFGPGTSISPAAFPDVTLSLDDLLLRG